MLAKFATDKPIPRQAWITVTSGGNDDKPRWSPDSRTLYFMSERDGFRCVWGQRIDPASLTLVGQAFPVYHSHRARRSMKNIPLSAFSMWIAGNELFFIQAEQTGNIWLMEPAQ